MDAADAAAKVWPRWMPDAVLSQYLKEVHGIDLAPKTIRNKRAAGRGFPCRYMGNTPVHSPPVVDQYIETNLLRDTSPIAEARARKRRQAAEEISAE
jgi:hypothetical protein